MSPHNHRVPFAESQHYIINPTNPHGAFHNRVKHRLHVRGRAADDAEHLGRRRLMLQRLAQFCVAFLDFFEQPHVLDSDDGLIGEGFEQSYLFLCEGLNLQCGECKSPRSVRLPAEAAWQGLYECRDASHSLAKGVLGCRLC